MTRKEFFEKLAEVKDNFKWEFGDGIRGRLKHRNQNTPDCCFCPIEAVYYSTMEKKSEYEPFGICGKIEDLGLDNMVSNQIIKAADYHGAKLTTRRLKEILMG